MTKIIATINLNNKKILATKTVLDKNLISLLLIVKNLSNKKKK